MSIYLLALLIGVVAGLRTMTAPAAVSWGAALGWVPLSGSWAAFMGYRFTPYIFSILALAEYVADKLPSKPSRKVPPQFSARLVSGAFCGAVIGTPGGSIIGGLIAGMVGAVIGTLGGAELRGRLVKGIGCNDRPVAFLEDAIAIAIAVLVLRAVS